MPDELKWTHVTNTQLVDYFDKDLTGDEEDRIEIHLARCEECAQRAREAYTRCNRWEQWSARSYNEAFLRVVIRNALESVAGEVLEDDTWKGRIYHWRSASAGLADGVVKVTIEAVKNASRIVTEGMDDLLRPGARWQFTLQTDPIAVRGAAGGRKQPPKIALAGGSGGSAARVKVEDHDDSAREVVISVDQFPRSQPAPIVILTSIGNRGKDKPRILQMRRQGQGLIARYKDLPAGEYLVVFEPLSAADTR